MNKFISLFVFGIFVLLVGSSCSPSQAADKTSAPLTTVRVSPIGREDIADVLKYVVDLKPELDVKIFSAVPDRIVHFPWVEGQEIKRGQTIALIRKEGLDRGLEQLVAQAEALDAQVQNLEVELGRSRELRQKGLLSSQMFDQIESQYKAAVAQRKALVASQGQLSAAAKNAVLLSPIDGIIANKALETGDMAVPQVPLCQVMAIDRLKAKLELMEADVAKVKLGQEVAVVLDALPGQTFKGVVTSILPFLNIGTRTNTVEVLLDNPKDAASSQRLLKPGMFGQAEIVVSLHAAAVVAPEPALMLDDGTNAEKTDRRFLRRAFVVDEQNIARERHVQLGPRKGSVYMILDGLAEGDRVVVRGQHSLKDGQKVEVVTAAVQ